MTTPLIERQEQESASHELPDWQVPLEEAVPLLVKYADAGDISAAFELSIRLSACTEHALREARASDQRDLELMENDKHNERLTDELRTVRNKNSQFRLDQNAGSRRGCEKVPAELRAHWLDGIDRAARSGNVWAKLQYGQLAIGDYDSVAAIVANVDEVIARRDKARAYLFEALQSGDPRSLRALADSYAIGSDSTPRLFAPDASKAYAYMYAGMLAGNYPQSFLDWTIANGNVPLTAAQMAAAEAEGRRIYEQCCLRH